MSDGRVRLRRDIISTDHLLPSEAASFRRAFDRLEHLLRRVCDRNTFLLPEQTLLFVDNERMVHCRSRVLDPP